MKNLYYLVVSFLLISSSTSFAQQKKANKIWSKIKLGKGLSATAKDSSFRIKAGFRFQSRFETSGDLTGIKDWKSNFLTRRARLKFDGWAFSPKLVYKIELGLSPSNLKATKEYKEAGGAAKVILDAVLKWKFHKNFTLWAGQTKLPGNRQRLVSSQKLQLVDRSEVNSIFNIDGDGKTYYTGSGFNVQMGYLFKKNIEIAGRYTTVAPSWSGSFSGKNEYTLGISKYVVGHSLKVQTDVTLIDKFGSTDPALRYRLQAELGF